MGILKSMRTRWGELRTAQKIGVVIDTVCGLAGGFTSMALGDKVCEAAGAEGKLSRFCIKTATFGAIAKASEVSADYLKESFGDPVGEILDVARGKRKITGVKVGEVKPGTEGIIFESEEG